MKQEGGSKRKLSKRKDAEAAVSYYNEVGYPVVCVIEYLLNNFLYSKTSYIQTHCISY